jgi:hypothetical protein
MMKGGKYPRILAVNANGETMFFNSLISASEVIGKTPVEIWSAIKNDCLIEGWSLKHHGSKDKIPECLKKEKIKIRNEFGQQPKKKLKVKDFETNEISIFNSYVKRPIILIQPLHIFTILYKRIMSLNY